MSGIRRARPPHRPRQAPSRRQRRGDLCAGFRPLYLHLPSPWLSRLLRQLGLGHDPTIDRQFTASCPPFFEGGGTGSFDCSTPQKPTNDAGFRQRAHDDAALVRTDRTDPPPALLQVRILLLCPFLLPTLLPFTTDARARRETLKRAGGGPMRSVRSLRSLARLQVKSCSDMTAYTLTAAQSIDTGQCCRRTLPRLKIQSGFQPCGAAQTDLDVEPHPAIAELPQPALGLAVCGTRCSRCP